MRLSPATAIATIAALAGLAAGQIAGPGCADGTREGFGDAVRHPKIAACKGCIETVVVNNPSFERDEHGLAYNYTVPEGWSGSGVRGEDPGMCPRRGASTEAAEGRGGPC